MAVSRRVITFRTAVSNSIVRITLFKQLFCFGFLPCLLKGDGLGEEAVDMMSPSILSALAAIISFLQYLSQQL